MWIGAYEKGRLALGPAARQEAPSHASLTVFKVTNIYVLCNYQTDETDDLVPGYLYTIDHIPVTVFFQKFRIRI